MNSHKTVYKGVEYPSLIAVCLAAHVSEPALRSYVLRHPELKDLSFEDKLAAWREGISFRKSSARQPVVYKGVTYTSIAHGCRALGIRRSTVRRAMNAGHAFDVAVRLARYSLACRVAREPVDHTGQMFNSLREMADAWDVNYNLLWYRLHKGWSIRRALTAESRRYGCAVDHTGQRFDSVPAMCAAWGISADLYYRRRQRGASLEEALTRPICRGRRGISPWEAFKKSFCVGVKK